MSWSTSELRVTFAPWNWFKLSSKIFYLPFQGGTSFVDILCFFLSCVCYAFVRVCLFVPCGHLLGKGWPLGSRLWCISVSLSLSHWNHGSGLVIDCIESWPLQPYLLWTQCLTPKCLPNVQNDPNNPMTTRVIAHYSYKYDNLALLVRICDFGTAGAYLSPGHISSVLIHFNEYNLEKLNF